MWVTAIPASSAAPDPDLVQCGQEDGDRALAPGLDEHGRRALDEVAGGDPLPATEHGVDLEHTGGDGTRRRDRGEGVAALGVVDVKAGIRVAVRVRSVGVGPAHRRLLRPG